MTYYKRNTLDGVTPGSTPTTGTQGSSGDTITAATTSGTMTGTTTTGEPVYGAGAVKFVFTSATEGGTSISFAGESLAAAGVRAWYRFVSGTPASYTAFQTLRSTSAQIVNVSYGNGGLFQVTDAAGTVLYTTPTAITLPAIVGVDLSVQPGTSTTTGKVKFALYNTDGSFAGGMTAAFENTACNAGTANLASIRFGRYGTAAAAQTYVIDDPTLQNSYGLLGPTTANAAPVGTISGPSTVATGSLITINAGATDDVSVTTLAVTNTTFPSGASALTMSGTATGTGTGTASIVSTATPTVAGTYVFTATSYDGTLTTTITWTTVVTGATVGMDSITSNPGAWAKFGSAADIPTSVNDTDPTTGMSVTSGAGAAVTFLAKPLGTGSAVTLTYTADCASGTPASVLTVSIYQGATLVETRSDTLAITTTTYVLTVSAPHLSLITDRTALSVVVSYT